MWETKWSRCVDLGTKLKNDKHEVIDEIKKVDEVNFRDFVESLRTLEPRRANDEIQAVKSVLRIIHHLKRVWLAKCNLGADHLRILCDVFNGVKINELNIFDSLRYKTDAETWRQLGILVHQCRLKTLEAERCNPTTECLEGFIEGLNGAQINKLNISHSLRQTNDAETWGQLGILVHQCGLKTLEARRCRLTAECLERFIQGMNGAQVTNQIRINELDISSSLDCNTDAETWRQLGILVHQCGLKTLMAEECHPTAECLKRFIQETNGAQFDELYINADDVDVCHLIARIVHQCGLKKLNLGFLTFEDLKKLIQGMNGSHLDHIVMRLKYGDKFPISDVLKLLPLINEKLHILNSINDKKVVEALQEKLYEDHLRSLTIELYNGFLKASPKDLPPNLPEVEDFTAETTNGSVLLNWCPLSVPNVSYYIVVETEKDGKAVGGPIITNKTSFQLPYLRSKTWYIFFIWGFTNDAISWRVFVRCHYTGKLNESHLSPESCIKQNNAERSGALNPEANEPTMAGNSHINESPGTSQNNGASLNDWFNTAGQYKSPLECQASANGQGSLFRTFGGSEIMMAKNRNLATQRGNGISTQKKPEVDLQQFILFRNAEGNLFPSAATSTALAVPYASVHHNVQQTYIQQDTSNSVQQQPHQYPAVGDGTMYNSADQGLQQPAMPVVNNPAPVSQDSQSFRAATFIAPAVSYASVHANMQQTYIQQDTSNYVQKQSHQYPAVADGTTHNSADQGLQQPVIPVVNNPAPVMQESQRCDANTSTGATEFAQLTTVNPSADYDMGASAGYGYPIDQSGMNAYQQTVGQAAAFPVDQTFNNDMNAHQQTADQADANSLGQTFNNAMNDHPSNSGQIAANSLDQTSNMESAAVRTRLDKLECLVASFQNMVKMQDAKMKEQEETITKLEKKVAALEGAGVSASADESQLPFILPMKTKDDVEENENLLEEKENGTKLVELLSKVGGTGNVAVWRVMGKLFTDRLAKQYSWTGRKAGKNPLRKLKMKEIIFRAGLMKNVDNEPCEKAVMRWLKNASDREGGRERRNKRKGEKSGAKQTE